MTRHRRYLRVCAALAVSLLAGSVVVAPPAGASPVTVVRPGDTLWDLAAANHVTLEDLAAANDMASADVLLAGQQLHIPPSLPVRRAAAMIAMPRAAAARSGLAHPGSARSPAAPAEPAAGPGPRSRATPAVDLAQQRSFCSHLVAPSWGPRGVLPELLAATPSRLALRPLFVRWAGAYGTPAALLEAVAWQESGWQSGVVSSTGAIGIGQLMPKTADFVAGSLLGLKLKSTVPQDNVRMSARLLGFLLESTHRNTCEAVASYYQGLDTLHRVGVLRETQPYVRNVLGLLPRFT